MRKFGLIGYPLGHSFSKKYFADKFAALGLNDCSYENYPLSDISLLNGILAAEPELVGLNVTIPHKSAVIPLLDAIDDEADKVGAVNVIKIKRINNRIILKGFNSDVTGFRVSISPYLHSKVNKAIVLGTGGSSKAVVYSLRNLGLDVKLVSRRPSGGMLGYSDLTPELMSEIRLIVNTTPLGMFPDLCSKPEINYDLLTENHILYDLVYNPEMTLFLRLGKEKGATAVSGITMLHAQAENAWEIWNNADL
jgi:shikimate dehydrogenase